MPRVRFLVIFLVLLGVFELTLLFDPVDRSVVRPFTHEIAVASGGILRNVASGVVVNGTMIVAPCFAVDIHNGCNGVEATMFIVAAVLAFPATWPQRAIGALAGTALIQIANLIRVVSLFLIGCYRRSWFEAAHLAVWQTIIFALAVGFFIMWSRRSVPVNASSA
ncbi:MAG TPA: exosortase H [Thermoanaerobaculia bacterium]